MLINENIASLRDFSPGSAVFSHFDPPGCVVADEDSPVFHAYDDAPEDPADDPYVLAFADLAASDIIHRFRHAGHPFDRVGFSGLGFIEG